MKKIIILLSFILILLISCNTNKKQEELIHDETSYGVFLGASPKDINYMLKYDEIVIDAQYFSADEINNIKSQNKKVYSYINVGSIEDFRDYYNDYKNITLGDYENWDEERWVDVSQNKWQVFIINLAQMILNKGVDGLFIDNVDVYYNYKNDNIFNGLTIILKELKNMTYTLINGGDEYVREYYKRFNNITDIMNGVNQETVFSKINFNKKDSFSKNESSEREYFQEYCEFVYDNKGDVYLLEYTKDNSLINKIDAYCEEHHFKYYASKTLELLAK